MYLSINQISKYFIAHILGMEIIVSFDTKHSCILSQLLVPYRYRQINLSFTVYLCSGAEDANGKNLL